MVVLLLDCGAEVDPQTRVSWKYFCRKSVLLIIVKIRTIIYLNSIFKTKVSKVVFKYKPSLGLLLVHLRNFLTTYRMVWHQCTALPGAGITKSSRRSSREVPRWKWRRWMDWPHSIWPSRETTKFAPRSSCSITPVSTRLQWLVAVQGCKR